MPAYPPPERDRTALERALLDTWTAERTFERSVSERPDAEPFTFYEGPPTANGRPGIHHVMARTVKDAFCRYQTLRGRRVERKAGWDTHGLPVEIEVEKRLGLKSRTDIEAYGIARYNAACRASVLEYKGLWDEVTTRMGYWVDLDHPYVTFETPYVESVWNLLKRLYDARTPDGQPVLYQGYKIQWYSPGSGTVLSSHEVAQGYREIQDPSVYVRFPVAGEPGTSLLAWTTTPWTLPSNVALAVNPAVTYAKVRVGDERLILAKPLLHVLKADYVVEAEMTGADLVGTRYDPPFDAFIAEHGAEAGWRVVPAEYVTVEDGTGIVHTSPAFGADDYATLQREDLPLLNPVRADGTFDRDFGDAAVKDLGFKEADRTLIRALKARGLLYREDSYVHNYPHDWRKGTPLMQYPVESWFVRTSAFTDRLVALNDTIRWQPEGMGKGRFGDWLKGGVDWALSRRRFWGTPLPIWRSDAPGSEHTECVGSIAELMERLGGTIPDAALNPDTGALDLHRPYVDELTWPAPDGGTMRRVPDLIDVWFDSGAMPFAQWHYLKHPDGTEQNGEAFHRAFPADFIAEGVDQTRGWFYTLHAIATLLEDSVAYRAVVVNGLVLDAQGQKMSKSVGNTVDPFDVLGRHGADVVRWYMMANAPPWENLRFSEGGLRETQSKFFGTLENVYAFFATYANLDAPDVSAAPPAAARPELDRWILHRLARTTEAAGAAFDDYNPTRAARAIEAFVDDLSNWYLRRSRRRFWKDAAEGDGADKAAAYATVHTCLKTVAVLMSPIAPFLSDWLWRALRSDADADSVHLAGFPAVETAHLDDALDARMGLARAVSSLVLSLRQEAGLGVRQPLPRALVVLPVGAAEADLAAVRDVVLDEVNLKALDVTGPGSAFVARTAAPNFRVLGKKLGPRMKAAAEAIRAMTPAELDALATSGAVTLDAPDGPLALAAEDVEVRSEGVPGWRVASTDGVTVALDTNRDDALVAEGLARETVNRLQNLRKSAGLAVADRIAVAYAATGRLADVLADPDHARYIRNETLAVTFGPAESPPVASGAAPADTASDAATDTFTIEGDTLRVRLVRAV